VHCFVVKENRHNVTLRLLNWSVLETRIGKISEVPRDFVWTRPGRYGNSVKWPGTGERVGGTAMKQARHWLDRTDVLCGELESRAERREAPGSRAVSIGACRSPHGGRTGLLPVERRERCG
jgi:hypothetical protein